MKLYFAFYLDDGHNKELFTFIPRYRYTIVVTEDKKLAGTFYRPDDTISFRDLSEDSDLASGNQQGISV